MILAQLFKELVDLIYPKFPKCSVCDKQFQPYKVDLCSNCISKIEFVREDYCNKCGKVVANDNKLCSDCQQYDRYFDRARAVGVYNSGLKEYIRLFKYQGQRNLAKSLAKMMIIYIDRFYDINKFDLISYIPIHSNRLKKRGFNQAYLLAQQLADSFNLEIKQLLLRTKDTTKQSKLSKAERINNLKNKFKVIAPQLLKNKTILLVDDIYTTGSTVNHASKVLLDSGAIKVNIMTLATGKDFNLTKEND